MEDQLTQFNDSIGTLNRLNTIFRTLNYWNIHYNSSMIIRLLNVLRIEIDPFLHKDKERPVSKTMWEEILNVDTNQVGKRIQLCNQYELWLRDRAYAKGLLMARGDDPSKALT